MKYFNRLVIFIFFCTQYTVVSGQKNQPIYLDSVRSLVFQDTGSYIKLIRYCKCDWEYVDSNLIVPNIRKDIHFDIRRISQSMLKNIDNVSLIELKNLYADFLNYYNPKVKNMISGDTDKCYPFYYSVISYFEDIFLVFKVKDWSDREIYELYKNMDLNFIKSWKEKKYSYIFEPEYIGGKDIKAPNNYGLSVSYAQSIRKHLMEELKTHKWNDISNPDYELQDQYLSDQRYFLTNNPIPEIQEEIAHNINNWASHGLPLVFQMFPKIDSELLVKNLTYEILYNGRLKKLMYDNKGDEWNLFAMEKLSQRTSKTDMIINILKTELNKAKSNDEKINILKHFWYFPSDENTRFLLNYDKNTNQQQGSINKKILDVLSYHYRTKKVSKESIKKIDSYYQTEIK